MKYLRKKRFHLALWCVLIKCLTGLAQFIINRQPHLSLRICIDCPRNRRTLNDSMSVSFVDAIRRQMFKELENSTKNSTGARTHFFSVQEPS